MALGAGGGGEHEQGLFLVGVEQALTVQVQLTDHQAVREALGLGVAQSDLVAVPVGGELRAALARLAGELGRG